MFMKRLLGYLKYHPVITVLAPLFKMLEATFELFVPLVVAQMIDVGVANNDRPYIVVCFLILLAEEKMRPGLPRRLVQAALALLTAVLPSDWPLLAPV